MTDDTKRYDSITVTPRENSEVELVGAIPLPHVAYYRTKALAKLITSLELPGFRKGHVPETMVVKTLGEHAIMEETAEVALKDAYPRIVADEKLAVIGSPQVTITKLASGNPIEFKITTAVVPEVILPDYKTLAKEVSDEYKGETVNVTDKEVEDVITQLRENKWRIGHTKEAQSATPSSIEKKPDPSDLPELTLDVVKGFGDFASIDDFKVKLKENIHLDKERKAKEKRRGALGEKLIAGTKVVLPRILVEGELEKMLAQFKHDVAALGMPFPDYLKKINKTEDDLRNEWKKDAEKRATLQFALNAIAQKENITASPEDIGRETSHILTHHKDAKEESVRIYVTTLLTNEKVFQFLEGAID